MWTHRRYTCLIELKVFKKYACDSLNYHVCEARFLAQLTAYRCVNINDHSTSLLA